jgi:hypothetical protein
LPELYLIPEGSIQAERRQPGSQPRQANPNVPLLWTQSLTWLSDLLLQGLITPGDLDPLGRRLARPLGAEKVLVALVPATAAIADAMAKNDTRAVGVLGLGRSGLATARALVAGGARPLLWDDSPEARAKAELEARLQDELGIEIAPDESLGDAAQRGLEEALEAEAIKAGNEKLLNFLTGQVMKAASTKPNPKQVTELMRARLM